MRQQRSRQDERRKAYLRLYRNAVLESGQNARDQGQSSSPINNKGVAGWISPRFVYMYYGNIKKCDIADGPGVRVSLFVSGCTNKCENCFQPQTWDFFYGDPFTQKTEDELLEALAPSYIAGLTVLGGEPMEPSNQRALLPFLRRVKAAFPNKTVWIYSGFTYEEITSKGSHPHCEATEEILSLCDVLVDGRFVESLKDITLLFRGSSNQRIIDLKKTLKQGKVALYD